MKPGPAADADRNEATVSAGSFKDWLAAATDADHTDNDVPCGTCTACCRSSYFVHVRPDEHDTRRHIPKALLFPAPGRPKGHHLMGYDERGRCPMLLEDADGRTGSLGCSIYDHRPQTCRTFDCRVFAAAGVDPDDDGKSAIAERVRQWRFDDVPTDPEAQRLLDAVRRAAAYLDLHRPDLFDGGDHLEPPTTAGQLADLAVRAHPAFLGPDGDPTLEQVRKRLA
ncbi:MAG TPA: YkgJ family cysteine cluster protein [Acidimicrobiales bacterium]|nr:YkgJ family cysteine cluster protein [Acidimicrobiales bacterium]